MKILVCDIGNSRVKFGVSDAGGLSATFALPARAPATADSLAAILTTLTRKTGAENVAACVVCSVARDLNSRFRDALARAFDCPILFAPDDLPFPLKNRYKNPEQTGADRLAAAYAASLLFPDAASVVTIDYGTAVTFDLVSGNEFLGGLIFPGPETAETALRSRASALRDVRVEDVGEPEIPARDTAGAMRAGLLLGYLGATEKICAIYGEKATKPLKIVAAGEFAGILAERSSLFDAVKPALVLEGLRETFFRAYS